MIKKLTLSLLIITSSFYANALEFVGTQLENLNRTELNQLLISQGGKKETEDNLTTVYNLKGGKIPYAIWAKAYYNFDNQFVGLQIGFPYDTHNYIGIRKNLTEKYGKSNNSSFNEKLFFNKAEWKFSNNTSIEYNSDSFLKISGIDRRYNTSMYIFYRHDARRNKLVDELNKQHLKQEQSKLKGVF